MAMITPNESNPARAETSAPASGGTSGKPLGPSTNRAAELLREVVQRLAECEAAFSTIRMGTLNTQALAAEAVRRIMPVLIAARAHLNEQADVGSSLPSSVKGGSSVQAATAELGGDGSSSIGSRGSDAAGSIPPTSAPSQAEACPFCGTRTFTSGPNDSVTCRNPLPCPGRQVSTSLELWNRRAPAAAHAGEGLVERDRMWCTALVEALGGEDLKLMQRVTEAFNRLRDGPALTAARSAKGESPRPQAGREDVLSERDVAVALWRVGSPSHQTDFDELRIDAQEHWICLAREARRLLSITAPQREREPHCDGFDAFVRSVRRELESHGHSFELLSDVEAVIREVGPPTPSAPPKSSDTAQPSASREFVEAARALRAAIKINCGQHVVVGSFAHCDKLLAAFDTALAAMSRSAGKGTHKEIDDMNSCTKPAQFEILDGEPRHDHTTHACTEHVGVMLQAGRTSTVYEAPHGCKCCYVAAAPGTQTREDDEKAWLIEMPGPLFWSGRDGCGAWTTHADALRFARWQDADRIRISMGFDAAKVTEHVWCAAAPTQSNKAEVPGSPGFDSPRAQPVQCPGASAPSPTADDDGDVPSWVPSVQEIAWTIWDSDPMPGDVRMKTAEKVRRLIAHRHAERARGEREAVVEECAKVVEARAQERFDMHGHRESDTNATYFTGRDAEAHEIRDEEDESIAKAIRALHPTPQPGARKET